MPPSSKRNRRKKSLHKWGYKLIPFHVSMSSYVSMYSRYLYYFPSKLTIKFRKKSRQGQKEKENFTFIKVTEWIFFNEYVVSVRSNERTYLARLNQFLLFLTISTLSKKCLYTRTITRENVLRLQCDCYICIYMTEIWHVNYWKWTLQNLQALNRIPWHYDI